MTVMVVKISYELTKNYEVHSRYKVGIKFWINSEYTYTDAVLKDCKYLKLVLLQHKQSSSTGKPTIYIRTRPDVQQTHIWY